MVTPAHLCQLNSFSRVGDIGRSLMYQPTPKLTKIISASKWKPMAAAITASRGGR
jgi:hypothetical protein